MQHHAGLEAPQRREDEGRGGCHGDAQEGVLLEECLESRGCGRLCQGHQEQGGLQSDLVIHLGACENRCIRYIYIDLDIFQRLTQLNFVKLNQMSLFDTFFHPGGKCF